VVELNATEIEGWSTYPTVVAKKPRLTADVVGDDDAVMTGLARLSLTEPRLGRQSRSIRKAQQKLRKLVDDRAFAAYLVVEERTNGRVFDEALIAVRWAFEEGLREGASLRCPCAAVRAGEPGPSGIRRVPGAGRRVGRRSSRGS